MAIKYKITNLKTEHLTLKNHGTSHYVWDPWEELESGLTLLGLSAVFGAFNMGGSVGWVITTVTQFLSPESSLWNYIEDDDSRERCQEAYDYLLSERKSAYSRFVRKQESELQEQREFLFYDYE